jgi:hypothetical protein
VAARRLRHRPGRGRHHPLRRLNFLRAANPGVITWHATPGHVDETYTDTIKAAYRIEQLLGTDRRTTLAILTIAADGILGFKFTHGRIEITGDDDTQSFRIRTINPGPETVLVPVSREQARLVVPVLRDWANDGDVSVACQGVALAIDEAVTGVNLLGGTRS